MSENIVDIVARKIKLMPKNLQKILNDAAFLGQSRFDDSVLAGVDTESEEVEARPIMTLSKAQ